ncbi:hypothetical protein BRC81_14350 [Halobacteriales archaeon QS_1_68_20]|nr:MAG: hypothetical protein BRC81_14350 [Halobacteriales archaeon QS_1_68_20]
MVSIAGAGGYVPRYRIEREEIARQHGGAASGETAVAARDETPVTMAVEAAGTALARADLRGTELDAVFAASVTDPLAEHGIAAHVAYRHGAEGDVRTGDFRGSPRAATDAFAAGRHFVAATGGTALVVGADQMPVEPGHDDEPYSGAAAGAVVLDDADDAAAAVHDVAANTTGFVERHREHGEPAEAGDRRVAAEMGFGGVVPDAAERALAEAPDAPDAAVVAAPDQRTAAGAVSEIPGEVEHVSTFDRVGYAGTATFFLDLAHLLETAAGGTTAIAVAYGAGGADAVALTVRDEAPGRDEAADVTTVAEQLASAEYVTYAEHLRYRERPEYEGVTAE